MQLFTAKPSEFLKIRSKIALFFIIIIIFAFVYPPQIKADSNSSDTLEGEITNIYKEEQIKFDYSEGDQLYQELEVKITKGEIEGSKITVKNGHYPMTNVVKYKIGNKVIINKIKNIDGTTDYVITDFVRRTPMLVLAIIFAALTILIGKLRGASSLLGLLVSFAVIFGFIVPRIYAGDDPVSIVIVGSLLIIPATFYLSHGLNRKTTVAIFGTLVALILTGILANIFVAATNLTGYTSDEASFIQSIAPDKIFDVRNLLLAGIIIGVLGVLDDVTVSQSSVVEELKRANNKFKNTQLFTRAMSVGQDHISSMVNTLVLVYTGASLPLLILFLDSSRKFSEVINYEIVAEEIVRALVGSIGLILAVPITTFLAVVFISDNLKREVRKK